MDGLNRANVKLAFYILKHAFVSGINFQKCIFSRLFLGGRGLHINPFENVYFFHVAANTKIYTEDQPFYCANSE